MVARNNAEKLDTLDCQHQEVEEQRKLGYRNIKKRRKMGEVSTQSCHRTGT